MAQNGANAAQAVRDINNMCWPIYRRLKSPTTQEVVVTLTQRSCVVPRRYVEATSYQPLAVIDGVAESEHNTLLRLPKVEVQWKSRC